MAAMPRSASFVANDVRRTGSAAGPESSPGADGSVVVMDVLGTCRSGPVPGPLLVRCAIGG